MTQRIQRFKIKPIPNHRYLYLHETPFFLLYFMYTLFLCHLYIRILQTSLNLLKPNGHVMHHQFNIQQLYALPTLYLCVLYLSENKKRLVPFTA